MYSRYFFHLFEDTNSNDCAISRREFAWNAPWHLRIFFTNRKYNLAPNDNHLDGYKYFLFKFLASLLVLFLFYWVFTFSWTPKDELVDGEETLKSLVPPAGVRAKLLAKIEKLKASEQSSFPLPGMTMRFWRVNHWRTVHQLAAKTWTIQTT